MTDLLTLRPYQVAALEAVDKAQAAGQRRVIIAHATGLGKTCVFSTLIARRPGRALVLAHRDELIGQAVDKLRMVAGDGLDIGVVKAERNEVHARVVVASVQTLARPARLEALVHADADSLFGPTEPFTTVVVDECHHASAATYGTVLDGTCGPDTLVVGVSATPERGDKRSLLKVFPGGIVHSMSTLDGIEGGWLTDVRAVNVGTDLDLSRVKVAHGDYTDASLGEEQERAGVPERVAAAWQEYASQRKGVVYWPTVATSKSCVKVLRGVGIAAEHIDGDTPEDQRRAILGRHRAGQTQVVSNCGVLTEGYDDPTIDCIVMARPTRSRVLYTQILGRALRPSPGKTEALLLDITGRADKVDLASVWNVLGLKDPAKVEAAKKAAEAGAGLLPPSVLEVVKADRDETERRTEEVTLFERSRIKWVSAGAAWVLSLPEGRMLRLVPDASSWTWAVDEMKGRRLVERHREGLTLEYAQGIAESIVRRRDGAMNLNHVNAGWRKKPASDKQIAFLRRLKVDVPAGLTAGTASELIAKAKAEKVAS